MNVNAHLNLLMCCGIGLLAILWLLAPASSADCSKDASGEVYCGGGSCVADRQGKIWCSRYYEGDAQSTRDGRVLCGKGHCAKDSYGEIFCSSERGGTVVKDSQGRVRCYGRCERATADNCENTRADSSVEGE
jgi:hypothetical protein